MESLVTVSAAFTAFIVSWLSGYVIVPLFRKKKYGQTIRDDGPKWHKSKDGTPTMGGVLIALGIAVGIALAIGVGKTFNSELVKSALMGKSLTVLLAGLGLTAAMGLIGFFDDYIKIKWRRNLGLTATQKTTLQAIVSAAYLISLALAGVDTTWLPFLGEVTVSKGIGLIFWPIAFFFVYGFTNAVNLTDGIDGLASAVTLVVCSGFIAVSGALRIYSVNIFAGAVAGALVGFIVWNWHPAKIFMGDTGSMMLGGAVVAMAFGTGKPIILMLMGLIYIIEALSVIIQVTYFNKTGLRLLRMSPIHHHFERCGWGELKIVLIFSAFTLLCNAVCFFLVV